MTTPSKVLVIMDLSAIESGLRSIGGVDTVCQSHLEGLKRYADGRYEYVVLGFNRTNDLPSDELVHRAGPNVVVHWYNYDRRKGIGRGLPNVVQNEWLIRKLVRRFRPDIVHSHNPAWHIVRYGGEKKVLTLHSYGKIARTPVGPLNDFLHERLIQPASVASSTVLSTVSMEVQDTLQRHTGRAISYIPNPVAEVFFDCDRTRQPGGPPRILLMGNVEIRKRTADALEVIDRLRTDYPGIKLIIAGRTGQDAAYLAQLRDFIRSRRMSDNVEFMGLLDTDAQLAQMRRASVGLFLSENETFGLAPLEMMAAGIPTVVAKTGVFNQYHAEFRKLGVSISQPGDIDSLTSAVHSRIASENFDVPPALRSFIRSSFSIEKYIARTEDLYRRALAEPAAQAYVQDVAVGTTTETRP